MHQAFQTFKRAFAFLSASCYLWQKVGADLFYFNGKTYLVVVDSFSRYPEVLKLHDTTSKGRIVTIKPIFARHGIPELFISDNGPQFTSQEMKQFAAIIISNPKTAQL